MKIFKEITRLTLAPYRGEHDGGIGSLNRRPNSENSGEFSSNSPCTVVVSALLARRFKPGVVELLQCFCDLNRGECLGTVP